MHLEKLVYKLLETYIGGDEYFDNLDLNNRKNNKYFRYMLDTIKNEDFDYIIVSGHFGKSFTNYCKKNNIYENKIILVNGSLRKNNEIDTKLIYKIDNKKVIFIDDSCYSKTTINKVKKFIEKSNGNFIKTYVFYDGCKEKDNNIVSFYRYYDNFEVS